jgi:hypothetical protein
MGFSIVLEINSARAFLKASELKDTGRFFGDNKLSKRTFHMLYLQNSKDRQLRIIITNLK